MMSVKVTNAVTKWYEVIVPWVPWHSNWGEQWIPEFRIFLAGPGENADTVEYDLDYFDQSPSGVGGQNNLSHYKVTGEVKVIGLLEPDSVEVQWSGPESPFPQYVVVKDTKGELIWSGNCAMTEGLSVSYTPPDKTYHRSTTISARWEESNAKVRVVIRDEWNQGFGWQVAETKHESDSIREVAEIPSRPVNWAYYAMDDYLFDNICEQAEHDGGLAPFGVMCLEASQTARFLDVNGIAYLKDAFAIVKFACSLAQGASGAAKNFNRAYSYGKAALACKNGKAAWRNAKPALKDAASLYLANHYGTRLTIKDTIEIANAIDERAPKSAGQNRQRVGASSTGSLDWTFPVERPHKVSHVAFRRRATLDIAIRDYETAWFCDKLTMIKRSLYELDLWPSASNLWDMVPFSFVFDWFGPIGAEFEYQEKLGYMRTLPIFRTFCSTTCAFSVEFLPDSGLEGKLKYHCYKRQCLSAPPPPPLTADTKPLSLPNWKNGIEAGALVTTMTL